MISLPMIGLLATALFDVRFSPHFKIGINPEIRINWRKCLGSTVFWSISLIFFIAFIGILNSEDMTYWLERVRIKLPFLLLPFAFYFLPKFNRRDVHFVFYFLLIFLGITCIGVLVNYAFNFEAFNELLATGKHIPVPRNHIRFSLLLAIAILGGFNLIAEGYFFKAKWEQWLIRILLVLLFLSIHILSVRSGIAVLYVGILFGIIRYVIIEKQYLKGILSMLFIACIPLASYFLIPSFQTKINYFRWDVISYFNKNNEAQRSDTGRLRSLKIGIDLFKEHPLLGVGVGDLKNEVYKYYDENHPDAFKKVMPHNQFLSVAAASGLVGLAFFLIGLFYPLFYGGAFKDYYLLMVFVAIVLSFMVENTIGNSTGVAIHCFFVLMLLNHLHLPEKN